MTSDMDDEEECLLNENKHKSSRNIIKKCLPDDLKKYWRTFLLSMTLLIAGTVFLILAVYIVFLPNSLNGPHSYVFFLVAFICIVPGAYHVIYMFFASRGVPGYKLYDLPTFTEE